MKLNTVRSLLNTILCLSLSELAIANEKQAAKDCTYNTQTDRWQCESLDYQVHERQLEFDWLAKPFLDAQSQEHLPAGCSGAYVDPFGRETSSEEAINALPLIIEANSAEVLEANTATLEGSVRVSQGPRSIAAEHMSYERALDKAELRGAVSIRQPDMLIRGETAKVSTTDHQSIFTEARFVMHSKHMRGSASSIRQDGPNRIVLTNGAISSCEPNSNGWSLEGEELSVDSEKSQGYGKNVKLKLGGVPVFYLPYITFPVGDERRSGFLFPGVSSSDDGGLDISVPYYLNLAPNYDMTFTPRFITGRGAMIETEGRHLNKYFSSEARGGFLANDSGGNLTTEDGEQSLNQQEGNNRWLAQFLQTGGQRSGWYSNIDYTKTSDADYFRDLGTSSFSVSNTTYLEQSIDGGIALDNWNLYARIQDYQTLLLNLDSPYRKVPELAAYGIVDILGVKLDINNNLTRFDHRDSTLLNGSPIITGERFFGDYRINKRFENTGAYFEPEAGFKTLSYRLHPVDTDPLNEENINLNARQFSVDTGAVFEHSDGHFLQTLEPRAKFLWREYKDHFELYDATENGQGINFDTTTRNFSYEQLYRDTRFSGSDRLDDARQLTVGLTNRWSAHDGHEYFSASFGRINHFQDRRIGLEQEVTDEANTSEWALEFDTNWRNGSKLYGGLLYDDGNRRIDRFSGGYSFASKNQLTLYSLAYSYVRADADISTSENIDQADGAFVTPINSQWYVMGRANYDIENKQELEAFFGFEYNNCCFRIRLLARRWLDSNIANLDVDDNAVYDQGLFFGLQLKGLGGSGAKVNDILEDAIPGYSRRENALNEH